MRLQRPRLFLSATTAAFVVLLGLGSAPLAHAQSLQELYDAARAYDASYLSARALLDSAQYRLEQSYALRRPSVGLQLQAGRQTSSTPDSPSTQQANSNSVGASLQGSQSLFNRQNDATIAQAEKSLDVSRADFETAEQDLILRISQAYFDVLAAQDTLGTARASLAAINEQVASAKRNFEVGNATITDTREAQARYDLARATEIQAQNDLLTKRIALDQLVGRQGVEPKALAPVPLALPPLSPSNVEDWVARADADHPAVRRARLGLDVARLETEKAKAGNLPTVALNASVGKGRQWVAGQAGFPFDYRTPSTSSSIGVALNVPLYAGGSIQNRVKETLALEDKSTQDLEAARRAVVQATRTAYYGLQSGTAQVAALEAAESSSQLALEATQLGYKVGVRVNLDVLNAQAQLYNTQSQLARARYDLVVANLRLRQAAGRVTPDDVAAVNRLLKQ
jgi:outer membrane protein